MKRLWLYLIIIVGLLTACNDNDSFTTSRSDLLTFSVDTVKMDTVFSGVGSMTYTFWVFNHSTDGIRLKSVRLRQGNQTGFRVNVDGSYLDNQLGAVVTNLEVRKGDSLRVFVELTSPETGADEPQLVEDNLLFQLESGVEQSVCLRSWAWDAVKYDSLVVSQDMTIESVKPVVVYQGLRVDSGATLTIKSTTLFFHDKAGVDVYGRLMTEGTAAQRVVMRGDRLDHMFDYLPYDRVSGQWRGVRFFGSSTGNVLVQTEIRNAMDAVVCDSADYDETQMRLVMDRCIIHNANGTAFRSVNANVGLYSTLVSNALGDLVAVHGGRAELLYCTLAQFYPFSADRGSALRFTNYHDDADLPLHGLVCVNTLVTGYGEDVVMGETRDSLTLFDYYFDHCLLRTPEVADTTRFVSIIWEQQTDSLQGKLHFAIVDEDNLYYDFHLDSLSTARGQAAPFYNEYAPFDLDDRLRHAEFPDLGCLQYCREEE